MCATLIRTLKVNCLCARMLGRLCGSSRRYATRTPVSKLRNIGIIAHIDAGKTTTTERMLYYSGKINRIGNVDQGDTITDFLPQEKSRGITIQSAAISFNWQRDYKINLIDTPGHADFTFEVIRAVKVLDGCVTILDAVAGVEAQTEKVWKQSQGSPKVCFINKMDRVGAGFSRTVKELIVKMKTRVVLINIPLFVKDSSGQESKQEGVIDILNMKMLKWNPEDHDKIDVVDISESDTEVYDQLLKCRESMIETLGESDDELVEYFLDQAEGDYLKVPANILNGSIRKATLNHFVTPVLCGASFRNIGVQPLLDAVVNYLPSPVEATFPQINHPSLPMKVDPNSGIILNNNKNLCVALAFKVITDPIRGIMVFVRVYSGKLHNGNTVYNSSTEKKFKIGKLVVMHANIYEEVSSLNAGEIGVLVGATVAENVSTGDTIVTHSLKKDGLRSLDRKKELTLKINPIAIPPPVFSVCIEPRTLGNKKSMEDALATLIREDPSFHVTYDEETGQTLLSGMGELHLEIAKYKLINELHADVEIGRVMVSYKETLNLPTKEETTKTDSGYSFTLSIVPLPLHEDTLDVVARAQHETWYPLGSDNNYLIMENHQNYTAEEDWNFQISYQAVINALVSSSIVALQKGGKIANFPLHSCAVRLKGNWTLPLDIENPSEILSLSRKLSLKVISEVSQNDFSVLEPVMNLEISVPQRDMGSIIQDLTGSRNANILSIDDDSADPNGDKTGVEYQEIAQHQYLPPDLTLKSANLGDESASMKSIKAQVPLRDMVSYTSKFRSLTQGRGTFHMDYCGMDKVNADRLNSIINE